MVLSQSTGSLDPVAIFDKGIGRLMTVKDVARFLSCSERTIRLWISRRILPVVRPAPRMVRFDPREILQWLAERKG